MMSILAISSVLCLFLGTSLGQNGYNTRYQQPQAYPNQGQQYWTAPPQSQYNNRFQQGARYQQPHYGQYGYNQGQYGYNQGDYYQPSPNGQYGYNQGPYNNYGYGPRQMAARNPSWQGYQQTPYDQSQVGQAGGAEYGGLKAGSGQFARAQCIPRPGVNCETNADQRYDNTVSTNSNGRKMAESQGGSDASTRNRSQ